MYACFSKPRSQQPMITTESPPFSFSFSPVAYPAV